MINTKVTHSTFGTGEIVEITENGCIVVRFSCGDKKFVYPEALFNGFLSPEVGEFTDKSRQLYETNEAEKRKTAEIRNARFTVEAKKEPKKPRATTTTRAKKKTVKEGLKEAK